MGRSGAKKLPLPSDDPLSPEEFARGFIAALVANGRAAIMPTDPRDRAGLYRAYTFVKGKVDALTNSGRTKGDRFYALVRVRNALKPSNNGAFDSMENLLRAQQLSLTSSPNPFYEQIGLNISKTYANALLAEFDPKDRKFIAEVADRFLQTEALVD
jgi:hypothetical protein